MKIATSLRGANKIIASQKSKMLIGKKLELGKEYSILFPKKDGDIVISAMIGRNCDFESLGLSFVSLSENEMKINEDTGRITDLSNMKKWSVISSLLYKASKAMDIERKRKEAIELAERSGSKIDESALAQAIEKINEAYDGRPRQGDQAAVPPTKQRLISSSIQTSIATEAILIPLDNELKPDYKNACTVEVNLSPTKARQLGEILDNPNYCDQNDPDGFLEIKFSYKGKDKKEAGKNNYLGVELANRKIDLEKDATGQYLNVNTRIISNLLNDVTHDDEVMYSRSSSVSFAKTSEDLDAAMRKYLANNKVLSLYIDFEDDMLKRNAKDVLEFGIFNKDSKQYRELEEIVKEQDSSDNKENIDVVEDLSKGIKEISNANSVGDVTKVLEENPDVEETFSDIEDI